MYEIIKRALFCLEPEVAHDVTLKSLNFIPRAFFPKSVDKPFECMGLSFANRVGLAAGLDKNGDYIDGLAKLGFGFIEIGTITPKPQPGNPKPRLFRIPSMHAIINRMGFNNAGVDALVENVKRAQYRGILGINIGKNKDTPLEKAVDDYIYCLHKVYPHASYITVNISSPNTPDLRKLQQADYLSDFIKQIKAQHLLCADEHKKYVPLVLKISPDESQQTMEQIAKILLENKIDGLIATNTTCSRDGLENQKHQHEAGGLSGAPLAMRSTQKIKLLHELLGYEIPIIGVGGITDVDSANAKIEAGASLVQIYSGMIYQGPRLISEIAKQL